MSTSPRILITSGAGKTGLQVALQLRERGIPVRAFVRRRDQRSEALERAGVELFLGNQYSLTDMRAAMQGVQRAYQCAPTAPNGLHFNAVFTIAAHEARLEHVVTMSQWLSSVDHPSLFTREVYLSDVLIGMHSEMSVTTVNPGWFADNYLMVLDMVAHLGMFTMPLGDGDTPKNAPPSNGDIASVITAALAEPGDHAGRVYRPTGPELLSPNDLAAAMSRALSRPVRYVDISERMMVKALKALRPPNFSVAMLTQLAIYADEYRRGAFAVGAPTDHVERVGGREPESFECIVRDAAARRPELSRSVGRSARAMAAFLKILATPAIDLPHAADARDFVKLEVPVYCQEDEGWLGGHASVGGDPGAPRAA